MIVGYARTSTMDQTAGLEAQERELRDAGCDKLFVEQVSSVDVRARDRLAEALDYVRDGDTLGRHEAGPSGSFSGSPAGGSGGSDGQGCIPSHSESMGIDTGTATGKLMLTLLGGVAEFERSIMLERQREGIAKAKAAGKYKGRKPTAMAKSDDVRALRAKGMKPNDIAKEVGIGRASVYRILAS